MERPSVQHLNLYELRLLVSERILGEAASAIPEQARNRMKSHLDGCSECQQLLEQETILTRLSAQRSTKDAGAGTSECPSEQEWMELVAGLRSPLEMDQKFEHALRCDHCGPIFKTAAEQFAEETTKEEKQVLNALQSAGPGWQQMIAQRMQSHSVRRHTAPSKWDWWNKRGIILQLAGATSIAMLIFVVWRGLNVPSSKTVDRLLAEAYSERRCSDLRTVGAAYAPVQALRAGEASGIRRPTALLEAEVVIAKELAAKPDDPYWLDAQGRADLMEGDYSSAVSVLEHAHRTAPQSANTRTDLATAYFLKAEVLKRAEDYGRSVELLGQVLAENPSDSIALFNRAIASERLLLYHQAVEDWHRYLQLDRNSPWANEARTRLAELENKINLQKNRTAEPLLGPSEFLATLGDDPENACPECDQRIEQYVELALLDWVPRAYANPPRPERGTMPERMASDRLARILVRRHGEHWLADFLQGLNNGPSSREGLFSLIDAIRSAKTTDLDHARQAAIHAAALFHRSGNQAGESLGRFEASYADQLAHESTRCLSEASAGNDIRVGRRYPWLHAQLLLESAACLNLNTEEARRLASEALTSARLHHYPSLELRAIGSLANLYEYMGDTRSAWHFFAEGLHRYWVGDYPLMRGYSLYAGLDLIAEDTEQWFLDVQLIEEGIRFIAEDPDVDMRAMEQHRLSNAFLMTRDLSAAEQTLNEALTLSARSEAGTRKENLEFEAQVGLAKVELLRSQPGEAIRRLEVLRQQAQTLSDEDLAFDYFRNLGLAYFELGNSHLAAQELGKALGLAEDSLRMDGDERARLLWSRKADRAYRAMVQLKLGGPPTEAFAQWEWFKGASLRGGSVGKDRRSPKNNSPTVIDLLPISSELPTGTAIVSFAVFPGISVVWVYSHAGVVQHRIDISGDEIQSLARRYGDDCSRPDSSLNTLEAEGRILYGKLFQPIEPLLDSYTHLVIEPDQALWLIPFETLMDGKGTFLGDRFGISLSPGLDYIAPSVASAGISKESRIVIAADPETNGRRPLLEAEEEAKEIARQFRSSVLLLNNDADYGRIAERVSEAEIFHFSGHAAPSRDGVGLLLGDSAVMDVSRIRARDFSGLKLAVLSACYTANGSTGVFDDQDSLARLLVGAGVSEVVASRWAVNSRYTSDLMEQFYVQLLSGKSASVGLWEAAHKLRTRREYSHPFYWASFSAFGKS